MSETGERSTYGKIVLGLDFAAFAATLVPAVALYTDAVAWQHIHVVGALVQLVAGLLILRHHRAVARAAAATCDAPELPVGPPGLPSQELGLLHLGFGVLAAAAVAFDKEAFGKLTAPVFVGEAVFRLFYALVLTGWLVQVPPESRSLFCCFVADAMLARAAALLVPLARNLAQVSAQDLAAGLSLGLAYVAMLPRQPPAAAE
eukprot:TRINITY_DN7981_c0_g1_i1.p2 TRINITY_DN7981_c0_g1~~TRINITY_DN7981_c0_g1_i1.p2  ORF type:complete len:203 (+),score=70.92 TRINITY_DN7981_c0_g1_i1:2-610(+)